jgi:hypothetical protein
MLQKDGAFAPPSGPGLGVKIREDYIVRVKGAAFPGC